MVDFKEFADKLQQEVIADMANAFFGARKNLDDMIASFESSVKDLRTLEPQLSQAAARLHLLLLDRKTARDFYIALDIVPSCIPFSDEIPRPFFEALPFGFSRAGQYERCVCRAYALFQQIADEYLNGRYYSDPEKKGRKRLTVHYLRLKAFAEHINDEIARINDSTSPSGILRYVKGMDPVQMEKEELIGTACLIEGGALDADLKIAPLDFEGLRLPVVQDLPSLKKVKDAIRLFCKEIYPSRKNEILRAMEALRDG